MLVTVIVPVRNEERTIGPCLDSLLAGDYPDSRTEVLVVDGRSTDRTREIVEGYIRRCPFIRLLDNPARIQAAGLNRALMHARGEFVIRMDAHTTYARDYVSTCIALLQNSGAWSVGGVQAPRGDGPIGKAVALATESCLGLASARYRSNLRTERVDAVYLGAWRRQHLMELGGFSEESGTDEDYELSCRIREAGGSILRSPHVRCAYHVRSTIPALAKQYFFYGYWKAKTLYQHPQSLAARHIVQMVGSAAVVSIMMAAPFSLVPLTFGASVYAIACIAALASGLWRRGWQSALFLPVVFPTMHLFYAFGMTSGFCGIAARQMRDLAKPRRQPSEVGPDTCAL